MRHLIFVVVMFFYPFLCASHMWSHLNLISADMLFVLYCIHMYMRVYSYISSGKGAVYMYVPPTKFIYARTMEY